MAQTRASTTPKQTPTRPRRTCATRHSNASTPSIHEATSTTLRKRKRGPQHKKKEGQETELWAAEIIDETREQYYLHWLGTDINGKPWAPSWEPKSHATPDLIEEWEEKKRQQRRLKETTPSRQPPKQRAAGFLGSNRDFGNDGVRSSDTPSHLSKRLRRNDSEVISAARRRESEGTTPQTPSSIHSLSRLAATNQSEAGLKSPQNSETSISFPEVRDEIHQPSAYPVVDQHTPTRIHPDVVPTQDKEFPRAEFEYYSIPISDQPQASQEQSRTQQSSREDTSLDTAQFFTQQETPAVDHTSVTSPFIVPDSQSDLGSCSYISSTSGPSQSTLVPSSGQGSSVFGGQFSSQNGSKLEEQTEQSLVPSEGRSAIDNHSDVGEQTRSENISTTGGLSSIDITIPETDPIETSGIVADYEDCSEANGTSSRHTESSASSPPPEDIAESSQLQNKSVDISQESTQGAKDKSTTAPSIELPLPIDWSTRGEKDIPTETTDPSYQPSLSTEGAFTPLGTVARDLAENHSYQDAQRHDYYPSEAENSVKVGVPDDPQHCKGTNITVEPSYTNPRPISDAAQLANQDLQENNFSSIPSCTVDYLQAEGVQPVFFSPTRPSILSGASLGSDQPTGAELNRYNRDSDSVRIVKHLEAPLCTQPTGLLRPTSEDSSKSPINLDCQESSISRDSGKEDREKNINHPKLQQHSVLSCYPLGPLDESKTEVPPVEVSEASASQRVSSVELDTISKEVQLRLVINQNKQIPETPVTRTELNLLERLRKTIPVLKTGSQVQKFDNIDFDHSNSIPIIPPPPSGSPSLNSSPSQSLCSLSAMSDSHHYIKGKLEEGTTNDVQIAPKSVVRLLNSRTPNSTRSPSVIPANALEELMLSERSKSSSGLVPVLSVDEAVADTDMSIGQAHDEEGYSSLLEGPRIGNGEFVIPLQLDPHQADYYYLCLKSGDETIQKFLKASLGDQDYISKEAEKLVEKLKNFLLHVDLNNPDTAITRTKSRDEAAWASESSVKFRFLESFFCRDAFRRSDLHVAILAKQGRVLDLLATFFEGKEINHRRPDIFRNRTYDLETFHYVSILPTTNPKIWPDQLNPRLNPHIDFIIALDNSCDLTSSFIRDVRTIHQKSTGLLAPVISLVVANSIEHIERCIVPSADPLKKLQLLLSCSEQLVHEIKKPSEICFEARPAAESLFRLCEFESASFPNKFVNINLVEWPFPTLPDIKDTVELYSSSEEFSVTSSAPHGTQEPTISRKRHLEFEEADSGKKIRTSPPDILLPDAPPLDVPPATDPEVFVTHVTDSPIKQTRIQDYKAEYETSVAAQKKMEAALTAKEKALRETRKTLDELQNRVEDQSKELRARNMTIETAEKGRDLYRARTQKQDDTIVAKNEEIQALKKQLQEALETLKRADNLDVAEIGLLREERNQLLAKYKKLELSVNNKDGDLEFFRKQYQERDAQLRESTSRISELEEENIRLKKLSDETKVSLREKATDHRYMAMAARVQRLEQERSVLQGLVKKQAIDLEKARNQRIGVGTRANSVPRSPRLGARGAGSRGGSPMPGVVGNRVGVLRGGLEGR